MVAVIVVAVMGRINPLRMIILHPLKCPGESNYNCFHYVDLLEMTRTQRFDSCSFFISILLGGVIWFVWFGLYI